MEPTSMMEEFAKLSTSAISDACDKFGIDAGCLGIRPICPGAKMVGRAYTIRYVPSGQTKGTVGDYIDEVRPGDVVVLDNHCRTDCTVWGDILTIVAKMRGIAGTVIEGVCRDVPGIVAEDYPLFARGAFMMTGKDRVFVEASQVTVSVGHRQVRPDDFLIGDDSGVVVVPRERAEQILETAMTIEAAEQSIIDAVRQGRTLAEARQEFGYHSLQTKQ